MTELHNQLEDPEKPKNSRPLSRLRKALGLDLDKLGLWAIVILLASSFAIYLYLNPAPKLVETVTEKIDPGVKTEPAPPKRSGTFTAKSRGVQTTIRTTGAVKARKYVTIASPIDGELLDLPAAVGASVTSDTVVAKFSSADLQQQLDKTEATYDLAQAELDSVKQSSEAGTEMIKIAELKSAVAKADLDMARAALAKIELKSPADGVLDSLSVAIGQYVMAGQKLGVVVDRRDYIVEAWIDQVDAFSLKLEAPAQITFAQRPNDKLKARIVKIGATITGDKGQGSSVPIQLQAEDGAKLDWLRTGLEGARVEIPVTRKVYLVPKSAVGLQGSRHVVLVRGEEGGFAPRPVQVGLSDMEVTEILDGLAEGEVLAVSEEI